MSDKKKVKIPATASSPGVGILSPIESKIFGFDAKRNDNPHINLKYYQSKFECFSSWTQEELRDLSSFIDKLSQSNWTDVFKSGGKSGSKSGFGMTFHKREALPKFPAIDQISEDIDFFELRVNQKARVHGFRNFSSFFLVLLDREHRIYPS